MTDCAGCAALLRGWDDILVLCHASPDGDTLGAAGALVRGLRALGKRAWAACGDEVGGKYRYLVEGLLAGGEAPAHVLSVDVATPELLGPLEKEYAAAIELAIDHHGSHKPFAKESWVDPKAAAACELLYQLLKELGAPIDKPMADCLYTGLTTDTGCFRYTNVTPLTHRIAAELLELGADAGEINRRMFECKPKAQVEAEKRILAGMEFFFEGKCAMVQVPQSVYKDTGAQASDLEGVASLPRQIEGVLVGVTLKEKEDGRVKASLRSNPPVSACAICEKFGGGGHKYAAGCTFEGASLAEAAGKITAAVQEHLAGLNLL